MKRNNNKLGKLGIVQFQCAFSQTDLSLNTFHTIQMTT